MLCVHSIACTSNSQQDTQCAYKSIKSVSVVCFEYVSVALVTQQAKRMRLIILSSVA